MSSQLCFTCVFQCSSQLCFTAKHWPGCGSQMWAWVSEGGVINAHWKCRTQLHHSSSPLWVRTQLHTRASQLFAFSPLCIFKCEWAPNCTPQTPPSQLFIFCQQDCNAMDTRRIQDLYETDCPVFGPKSESLQRVQWRHLHVSQLGYMHAQSHT